MSKNLCKKWIVLPDTQIPFEDKATLRGVEAYMEDEAKSDHPWDGWLQLGDLLDFGEISKYVEGRPGDVTERINDSFYHANQFLNRHESIVREHNNNTKMVILEGNHDYRVVDYVAKHPELKGMLDVDVNLGLPGRKIQWVRSWKDGKLYRVGNAYFTHGRFINEHHAKKMVQRYGTNIYYGHTHDVQEYPLVQLGKDKTIVGKSLGCLCRYDQKYMKGAPSNWQQAFAVFHFFPDGFFTEHTVRIFKNRFVGPNGLVYDGSKKEPRVGRA